MWHARRIKRIHLCGILKIGFNLLSDLNTRDHLEQLTDLEVYLKKNLTIIKENLKIIKLYKQHEKVKNPEDKCLDYSIESCNILIEIINLFYDLNTYELNIYT